MAAGSEYSLELDPLVHEIDPKQSSYRILSTKVEIKLKKKVEGIKWNNLEGEDTVPSNCKWLLFESIALAAHGWRQWHPPVSRAHANPKTGTRSYLILTRILSKRVAIRP